MEIDKFEELPVMAELAKQWRRLQENEVPEAVFNEEDDLSLRWAAKKHLWSEKVRPQLPERIDLTSSTGELVKVILFINGAKVIAGARGTLPEVMGRLRQMEYLAAAGRATPGQVEETFGGFETEAAAGNSMWFARIYQWVNFAKNFGLIEPRRLMELWAKSLEKVGGDQLLQHIYTLEIWATMKELVGSTAMEVASLYLKAIRLMIDMGKVDQERAEEMVYLMEQMDELGVETIDKAPFEALVLKKLEAVMSGHDTATPPEAKSLLEYIRQARMESGQKRDYARHFYDRGIEDDSIVEAVAGVLLATGDRKDFKTAAEMLLPRVRGLVNDYLARPLIRAAVPYQRMERLMRWAKKKYGFNWKNREWVNEWFMAAADLSGDEWYMEGGRLRTWIKKGRLDNYLVEMARLAAVHPERSEFAAMVVTRVKVTGDKYVRGKLDQNEVEKLALALLIIKWPDLAGKL